MWVAGHSVGDYSDSADLRGCLNWLIDSVSGADDRREPSLDDCSKEEVFRLIYETFVLTIPKGVHLLEYEPPEESDEMVAARLTYPDARNRFHLDHVGMSSFDQWSVILVARGDGAQRFIWKKSRDYKIFETILSEHCFEEVASKFIEWARVNL